MTDTRQMISADLVREYQELRARGGYVTDPSFDRLIEVERELTKRGLLTPATYEGVD